MNTATLSSVMVLLVLWLANFHVLSAEWRPAETGLRSIFSDKVNPTNAHREYPRPQLVRADWLNLNGLWDYSITQAGAPAPTNFSGKILVPFPVESSLSGVGVRFWETNRIWYRRTFTVPAEWANRRIRLNFGAVDWTAWVFVNGKEVARHRGGYDPFSVDITPFLNETNHQELTIAVEDPTEGEQPRGKQSRSPEGIFYSPSSGIWQTVWLEPVSAAHIDGLNLVPDLAGQSLRLKVLGNRMGAIFKAEAVALENGIEVARASGLVNGNLELRFEDPHPWSPKDPFLYELQITMYVDGNPVDKVTSYFALRDIAARKDALGVPRLFLNGEPVFQVGVLDQGFWPDGIYTAPSDEAWQYELRLLKEMGFNAVRKHVKVEPDRWYMWCDKLGLIVWQDMPSGNNITTSARRQFELEFERMVQNLQNHPCIVMWVIFNEGWGQYDTERLTSWAQKLDPERLVNAASGWVDKRVGHVIDIHSYPGPETPTLESSRVAVLGEFGGLGLAMKGHLWSQKTWGYEIAETPQQLQGRYSDLLKRVWMLRETSPLSGVIYTQLSDVETECNGLLTYDRAVVKMNVEAARAANEGLQKDPPFRLVSPTADYGRIIWRYVFKEPGPRWKLRGYNPFGWLRGRAGFGAPLALPDGAVARSPWNTSDVWLRRTFVFASNSDNSPQLRVRHFADAEIYLNGVLAAQVRGASEGYTNLPIAPEALQVLTEGANIMAVHARKNREYQFIDVGIVIPLK